MTENRLMQSGFAGAVALAAGSAAYGGIIVVSPPANILNAAAPTPTPPSGQIGWDVNGDATFDFGLQFRNPQANPTNGVQWQANMSPAVSGGTIALAGYQGTFINYADVLSAGTVIGPTLTGGNTWRNQAQVALGSFYRYSGTVSAYGPFSTGTVPSASVVRGFVGFRFLIAGQTRYGWLDVEVRGSSSAAGSGGIFFFGAAYEDTGDPIEAGAIPAPSALAALAIGAAALCRRKRDEAAA